MPSSSVRSTLIRGLTAGLVTIAFVGITAPVARAQSASTLYERALSREKSARAVNAVSVTTLRSIATAYESIVRRYPRSGYCDNALWQAAGMLQLAWDRGHNTRDRDKATSLLEWLRREYPSSSLVRQVPARLATLQATPRPATRAASRTEPAAPVPPATAATAATPALPAASVARAPDATLAALSTASVPAGSPMPTTLRSISYAKLPHGDRITLELSDEASFTAARAANPDQLVLDFAGVAADHDALVSAATLTGQFVDGLTVRAGADAPLQLRLQLAGAPRYSTFPLFDPYRLVIDVEGDPAALPPVRTAMVARAAAAAAPVATGPIIRPEAAESTSRGDYSLARQLGLGVSRIVIDPGHGGHDPGAQANHVSEADLVLDIALRLEKLLEAQPGFEVVLTRRTDTYVALEERTAIANQEHADMFLSIHANASPNATTRGIETYFLNFSTNAAAEAVAARENASSAQAMHILPEIVKTIATNDKVEESRELASMVQTSLMRRIGSLSKSIKNLGVKQAPFVVLIGAQMPSVLAEVSFLTNKTEAGLLRQAAHRQRIAQALCDAVINYQGSLKKVTAIAARTEPR